MSTLPVVRICKIPYLNATKEQLCAHLRALLLSSTSAPATVFTPNATIAEACRKNTALCTLISHATLCLPDGVGILAAARHCGTPLCSRLPGIEAGECALRLAAAHNLPVFFLGAAPGVARRAAMRQKALLPALPLAGSHHGYFDAHGEQNERLLARIRDSGARVVLVCLGFPAQERWIMENKDKLPGVRLLMGLGGSFDVWAGDVRRAPRLFRALRLEWLWRMLCNPTKFRSLPAMFSFVRHAKSEKNAESAVKIP